MPDRSIDPSAGALLRSAALRGTYPDYDGQLVHTRTQPAREADHVDPETVLPTELATALDTDLYAHQAAALEQLRAGENVTVATSTASGKTWIYTLYFALLKRQNPDARALFLYPTKALGTDQEQAVNDLLTRLDVDAKAAKYDGDTPSDRRPRVRDQADIVISNFAGINVYLNDHVKWRDIHRNCELLVLDESHTYTGIHGMHVAWTLRRLRRIIEYYGADPQLVCSTATIGNPGDHSEAVTGATFTVVDEDGSPRGRRDIAFWQPPVDEDGEASAEEGTDPALRRDATKEAAGVAAHLGCNGIRTLTFARSRQETEVGVKRAIDAARSHPRGGGISRSSRTTPVSASRRDGRPRTNSKAGRWMPSFRRTPSNSGSISGRSMRPSSRGTRGRDSRSGNRSVAPVGVSRMPSRCSCRVVMRSISTSSTIRTTS